MSLTGEFPRAIPRAIWLASRARNVVHRPVFIGAVGVGTFIAATVALVLAPQQVRHPGSVPQVTLAVRPDTAPLLAAVTQARSRMGAAEASLAAARTRASVVRAPVVDTLSPLLIRQRDSLSAAVNDLDALLTRVESAPVTGSYRALAESPQLTTNPHVRALLDSLADVEKDREAFGTSGATDPVYLALSARSSEIGRAIQNAAQQRREVLRQQISRVNAPSQRQALAETPAIDTAGWVAERDSAQSLLSQATTALSDARKKTAQFTLAERQANEGAALSAPPAALLGAALVLGIVLGFGAAFIDEMRHPRVSSDEHEVERITRARVLATIRPRPKDSARNRRRADQTTSRYFDPRADGYQLTYLHVARAGASRLMLTVAAPDPAIAAVVGMNLAAIAADEARSTILIDTDARRSPVAAGLRTHAEPGLADVVMDRLSWTDATTQAMVGRDRVIDVMPSGISATPLDASRVTGSFRAESARLARHYEAIIVTASTELAGAGLPATLQIPDTIVCARVGHTRVADLNRAIDAIRASGGKPLGIVLWEAPSPALPTADRIARAPRPLKTAEMGALSGAH